MDYREADSLLQGRCKQSRKIANNTYLRRDDWYHGGDNSIAVRLHRTDIITFYPNEKIEVGTGGWDTVTTRDRINRYLPSPWHVRGERGRTVLSNHQGREVNGEWVYTGTVEVLLDHSATIDPSGTVTDGKDLQEWRDEIRQQDNERKRERSRLNRWVEKARGWFRDSSECTQKEGWCSCHLRRGGWGRRHRWIQPEGVCSYCGCKAVYRKPNPGRLTVAKIMEEQNASVRTAMISCYGLERFFMDAKPLTVNKEAGYELLRIAIGEGWRTATLAVLRMECPSTGAVYVNAVPPQTDSVRAALNWMFSVPEGHDYLTEVSQAA